MLAAGGGDSPLDHTNIFVGAVEMVDWKQNDFGDFAASKNNPKYRKRKLLRTCIAGKIRV